MKSRIENGTLVIEGDVLVASTPSKEFDESKKMAKSMDPAKGLDLSKVGRCDSLLVALLVECKRLHPDIAIKLANFPSNLPPLLRLYHALDWFEYEGGDINLGDDVQPATSQSGE